MPRTNGAKIIARKNVRAGNRRFSSSATPSGTTTRNGTLATVKIAVFCIPIQKFSEITDSGSNRSR